MIHPSCNGLNRAQFELLGKTDEPWSCLNCNKPRNINKKDNSVKINLPKQDEFKTFDDCKICKKKVTGNKTLSCRTCRHWMHKKCIGNFTNNTEFSDFLKYYSDKDWDCPSCTAEILPFILLDDDEFLLELLDIFYKIPYIDKNYYKKILTKLNKIEFYNTNDNNEKTTSTGLDHIDPDLNYENFDTCDYKISTDDIIFNPTNQLTMATFNIRSIKKHFDEFTNFLNSVKPKIHVICLNETWLGPLDNIKDFEIEGYHTPLFQNRIGNKHGGGVATYIHKDIPKFKQIKNLSFVDEYNHCLATEIEINKKSTTLLNIYRSPHHSNELFLEKFDKIIENCRKNICYILGDSNYNLLNVDRHGKTEDYFNLLSTASFKPLITKPTRITDNKETLINHIWSNDLRNETIAKSNIVITDITDHLPCITSICNPEIILKGYTNVSKRDFNDKSKTEFRKKIEEAKGILAFYVNNTIEDDLNKKYNDYFYHITKIYNECFPIKTKKVHRKTNSKPWMTSEIMKLINNKNYRYSKKKKHNSPSNRKKYKKAKKDMEDLINKEKDSYYKKTN